MMAPPLPEGAVQLTLRLVALAALTVGVAVLLGGLANRSRLQLAVERLLRGPLMHSHR